MHALGVPTIAKMSIPDGRYFGGNGWHRRKEGGSWRQGEFMKVRGSKCKVTNRVATAAKSPKVVI
jgi:hypothetical protein